MSIDVSHWLWERYYQESPEQKTIEQYRSHGTDHKAYKWNPQIDPRWSDEQKAAYVQGYESYKD